MEFGWFPPTGNDRAVVTISIRRGADDDWPVILRRVLDEESQRVLVCAIPQRRGDRTVFITPEPLHEWIRRGRALERGEAPGTVPRPVAPGGPSDEQRARRLVEDVRAAGMDRRRRYYLQAWPRWNAEVRDLHKPGPTGLRKILSDPPQIRGDLGFGLRTYAEPEVLPGGGLRFIGARLALSLERNGLLTWVASAGDDYLAWAGTERGKPNSLHQLALVESTFEWCRLFALQVLPRCEPPSDIGWAVSGGFEELHEGGEPLLLAGGPLMKGFPQQIFATWRPAPSDTITIPELIFRDERPGVAAFRILREIYPNFGFDESAIPYAEDGEITDEQIARA